MDERGFAALKQISEELAPAKRVGFARFKETVMQGREGTTMPAFGALLSTDEIWAVFEFVLSRDKLQ